AGLERASVERREPDRGDDSGQPPREPPSGGHGAAIYQAVRPRTTAGPSVPYRKSGTRRAGSRGRWRRRSSSAYRNGYASSSLLASVHDPSAGHAHDFRYGTLVLLRRVRRRGHRGHRRRRLHGRVPGRRGLADLEQPPALDLALEHVLVLHRELDAAVLGHVELAGVGHERHALAVALGRELLGHERRELALEVGEHRIGARL